MVKLFFRNDLQMDIDSATIRQNGEDKNGSNDSSLGASNPVFGTKAAGFKVEWSKETGRTTRLGGLAYFAEFLESTSMFDLLVE